MCGGASQDEQNYQTTSELASTKNEAYKRALSQAEPYWSNILQSGLPYTSAQVDYTGGTLARQMGPQRAALTRSAAASGTSLSDPAYLKTMSDMGVKQARAFDDSVISALRENEAAKQSAANSYASLTDPTSLWALLRG